MPRDGERRLWLTDRRCIASGAFSTALDYWVPQARLWLADAMCGLFPDGDTPD
jgi:hypothetical protein